MPETLTEELRVPLCSAFDMAYSVMAAPVIDGHAHFRFSLCRKPLHLGAVTFDQLWMATNSVYGQRQTSGSNRDALADFFWASCLEYGREACNADTQTIYLLCKLLPLMRNNGGQHAFVDARLARWTSADVAELNELIIQGRDNRETMHEFQRKVGRLLGPPEFSSAAVSLYSRFEEELFSEPRRMLIREPQNALEALLSVWSQWSRRISRRSGNAAKKQILDVLSYEARAAIHRCYSHFWLNLMKQLVARGEMREEAVKFHQVWHSELLDNADSTLPNRHVFHGHIFELHPAGSNFIRTDAGCQLLGEYVVQQPGTREFGVAFQRLLNGLLIAICDFAARREEYSSLRNHPTSMPSEGLERVRAARGQQGRRVSNRRPTDRE